MSHSDFLAEEGRRTESPLDLPPTDLPLLRFDLRGLMVFVAGVSMFLAWSVRTGGIVAISGLFVVLIVAAHIAATTIGGRLRANTERRRQWHCAQGQPDPDGLEFRVFPLKTGPAPNSPVHPRATTPLGNLPKKLTWFPLLIAGGGIAGGLVGGYMLAALVGDQATMPALILGASSIGVLGAWFTFLISGFWSNFRTAWRTAVDEQNG